MKQMKKFEITTSGEMITVFGDRFRIESGVLYIYSEGHTVMAVPSGGWSLIAEIPAETK